ncbi:glycoside hydrolase family 3 N-terminal domain-containing protein [Marinitoga lauensis]|nr:glycoside hydrolase family 3 N-terminal domain-containing protein [Marinitoga lauensis]
MIKLYKRIKRTGILPTAKHFPGHGKATQDSHEETTIVNDFFF